MELVPAAQAETRVAPVVPRAAGLVAGARQIGGVAVVAARVDGLGAGGLRTLAESVLERFGSGVVCLGSVRSGRVSVVGAVTNDLISRFHAGQLVQEVARAVGGGGGRPDLAQAGGTNPAGLDAALAAVPDWVARAATAPESDEPPAPIS